MQLRGYQTSAIEGVSEAWRAGAKSVLLTVATGGGKTVIFSDVARRTGERGRRVLILAHRRELIRQASEKLTAAGTPHGIIAPGFSASRELVQVGSIQTVRRRLEQIAEPSLIVPDECHHTTAPEWGELFAAFPKAFILGVTATPERLDGLGLGRESGGHFDAMVQGPQTAELIADGYLTGARTFAPAHAVDLAGIRTQMGDYAIGQVAEAMTQAQVVGDAVSHYKRLCAHRPAILFSPSVAHAELMAQAFREAGFRGVAASGVTESRQRDAAIAGLATGATEVLCSCDLISEGLDVPVVACVILMRPTKSLGLYMQQGGRGLRPIYAPGFDLGTREGRLASIAASNKPQLIILDHAGNCQRHGMIEDAREWSLAGKRRKDSVAKVIQCPSCWETFGPRPVCPGCGHSFRKAQAENAGRKLRSIDGDLQEVSQDRIDVIKNADLKVLLRTAKTESDLHEIARIRGYNARWVMRVMIAKRRSHAAYKTGGAAR